MKTPSQSDGLLEIETRGAVYATPWTDIENHYVCGAQGAGVRRIGWMRQAGASKAALLC